MQILPTGRRALTQESGGILAVVLALSLGSGCGAQKHDETAERVEAELKDKTLHDYHDGCLASGCHSGLKKTRWVHGPVYVAACDACHLAEGEAADHLFALTRPKGELCGSCHPVSSITDFVHEPYVERDCVGCHDPHGGKTSDYLRGDSVAGLCATCHEPKEVAFSHTPVENGSCLDCHASHASREEHLLRHPEKVLCFKCHEEEKQLFARSAHVHQPVTESCHSCHVIHGGDHQALLPQVSSDLCIECHEDVQEGFSGTGSSHAAVAQDQKWCTHCHSPHSGKQRELLRVTREADLCLGCHDREIVLSSGRAIANIRDQMASARHLHGPIALGECRSCHLAHSSSYGLLLQEPYPDTLYVEFSVAAYGLCFNCHNRRLATDERTTLTDFRDGDRNLHHVHVHREKGRSCGACHEFHGTDRDRLMRTELSFGPGGWKMPLQFTETESGGTCGAGCHQALSYDNTTVTAEVKGASKRQD